MQAGCHRFDSDRVHHFHEAARPHAALGPSRREVRCFCRGTGVRWPISILGRLTGRQHGPCGCRAQAKSPSVRRQSQPHVLSQVGGHDRARRSAEARENRADGVPPASPAPFRRGSSDGFSRSSGWWVERGSWLASRVGGSIPPPFTSFPQGHPGGHGLLAQRNESTWLRTRGSGVRVPRRPPIPTFRERGARLTKFSRHKPLPR